MPSGEIPNETPNTETHEQAASIDKRVRRRTKVATALTAIGNLPAALLGVGGVAATVEAATAAPAHASAEATKTHETMPVRAFLNQQFTNMANLARDIEKAKGHASGPSAQGGYAYELYAKDKNPKYIDLLSLTVNQQGKNEIDSINILLAEDANLNNTKGGVEYTLQYVKGANGELSQDSLDLMVGKGEKSFYVYRIDAADDPVVLPHTVKYSKDASAVTANYSAFYKYAHQLLKHHIMAKKS